MHCSTTSLYIVIKLNLKTFTLCLLNGENSKFTSGLEVELGRLQCLVIDVYFVVTVSIKYFDVQVSNSIDKRKCWLMALGP